MPVSKSSPPYVTTCGHLPVGFLGTCYLWDMGVKPVPTILVTCHCKERTLESCSSAEKSAYIARALVIQKSC